MIKKITLITLFVLFAGALVAGGVYRTTARSANETHQETALGQQNHDGHAAEEGSIAAQESNPQSERQGQGLGNGGSGQGRNQNYQSELGIPSAGGQGQGRNRSAAEDGQTPEQGQGYQGGRGEQAAGAGATAEGFETVIVAGMVIQAPAAGVDMIIKTADGQEVLIGTGPGYLQEMGFELLAGDTVEVSGFWEEGEFKALTIDRDGDVIALRDEFGRPMWSGAARGGRGGGGNQGNGQGRQGQTG